MDDRTAAIRREGGALLMNLKVRPGAKRDQWRGIEGEAVKVDVSAVAEGGRATTHLIGFVAKSFGVRKADVELVSGAHSRQKRIRIEGAKKAPAELEIPGLPTT